MDLKQLDKLISLLKKRGISHYKCDGVELVLDLSHNPAPKSPIESAPESKPENELSDEELLTWSSAPVL